MSEPQRAADPSEGSPADIDERERSSRIEQLLLAGLDHYFAGQYEQAIDVWSRVAFLERRHGKARAYIERARGALAERQRESEELVDRGRAAFDAGDVLTARRLLTEAVSQSGSGDTAALLLERLNRVSGSAQTPGGTHADAARTAEAEGRPTNWVTTIVASAAVVAAVLVAGRMIAATLAEWPDARIAPVGHAEPLPELREGDMAVERARELYASGQVRQAIAVLQTVEAGDPGRTAADALRAAWQREVLAGVETSTSERTGGRP
jgi:tetratricopeptide (TPR) repeat protein